MGLRPDHFTKFTIPPIGSTLMIADGHVYGGELGIVMENIPNLIVSLVSTGEQVELVNRNHFNVILVPQQGGSNE